MAPEQILGGLQEWDWHRFRVRQVRVGFRAVTALSFDCHLNTAWTCHTQIPEV